MVEDAHLELAIGAGGGDVVLFDEGCEHAALDEIFAGWDMADPGFAGAVRGCSFDGAGEGVFVARVCGGEFGDAVGLVSDFEGHGLFADATALSLGQGSAIGEDLRPAGHLGLPDVVGDVGEIFPVEVENGESWHWSAFWGMGLP